jgi:hypothetical protein
VVKVRKLGADSLDSLYTAMKKCSLLCGKLPKMEHHTAVRTRERCQRIGAITRHGGCLAD